MNANSEESRNGRRGHDSKGPAHPRQSITPRDGTYNAPPIRRGGKQGSTVGKLSDTTPAALRSQSTTPPTALENHVFTGGFNADAVEAALRRGFDAKAPSYKPDMKASTTRPDGPWGVKPGTIANGKDFWLDLRKQVSNLRQSGGMSLGG